MVGTKQKHLKIEEVKYKSWDAGEIVNQRRKQKVQT